MKKSFKTASIWGFIWRFLVFSLLFGILLGFVSGLLFPFVDISGLVGLLMNLMIYAVVFYVVKDRVEKQYFSWDAFVGKKSIELKPILRIILITILIAVAASTFSYFLLMVINMSDTLIQLFLPFFEFLLSADGGISTINLFITAVIAAPIAEELFFRGYLLNKWAEKYKTTSAIFWSSFVFMIIHMPSLFVPQLILGLFCGIVYIKTKRIIYPILTHALYNFFVLLPVLILPEDAGTQSVSEELNRMFNPDAAMVQVFLIGSIIFIIAMILIIVSFKKIGKNINDEATPYLANIEQAPDFIEYEENKDEWEEKTFEPPKRYQKQKNEKDELEEEWEDLNIFIDDKLDNDEERDSSNKSEDE